jgi:hypothetical protein
MTALYHVLTQSLFYFNIRLIDVPAPFLFMNFPSPPNFCCATAMEMSPSKIQRSTEGGIEEDFTAFVESALSPLATGTYSQSADNSRDAPLLPSSQRSNASQQQIPLSVPSSNEWSPSGSQSGFGSNNGNEFKLCFPDAPSPGSFSGSVSTHPRMRHKKKEGEGNTSSQDHLLNSRQTLAARLKDGKYHGDDGASFGGVASISSSQQGAMGAIAGVIGVGTGRERSNSSGSFVGSSQGGAVIGAFPIMIPGYAQSTLELEEDSLGGAPAHSPHHVGGEMRIAHSPRKKHLDDVMSIDTTSYSNSGIGAATGKGSGNGKHGFGFGFGTGTGTGHGGDNSSSISTSPSRSRARRKTPKAAESRVVKNSKVSSKVAPVNSSSSSFGSLFKGTYQDTKIVCNCKKSRCLKLYCECFHALKYCNNCNCYDCENRVGNDEVREAVIASIKERNPDAFDSKIKSDETGNKGHQNGCHCKRSACLKKYCECFAMAVPCGIKCRCLKCQNTVSLYQLKNDNAAYTAHMLVSAAAASLEDTGEDYLNGQKSGTAGSADGSSISQAHIDEGNMSPVVTVAVYETGTNAATNSPRKRMGLGLAPPSSPGASLLELAGACTEQQKTEDTAIGLLALSPQRNKSAPSSPVRPSQGLPIPPPKFI